MKMTEIFVLLISFVYMYTCIVSIHTQITEIPHLPQCSIKVTTQHLFNLNQFTDDGC